MTVRPNTTLRDLCDGKVVFGGEATVGWAAVPLTYAAAGLDFVWIDTEHTCLDLGAVAGLIQTARLAGITPIVRVGAPEPSRIGPFLDNGAQGIIVPRMEDPEVVAQVVSFCRFPPDGARGCPGPLAANDFRPVTFTTYLSEANSEVLVSVQAESRRAVEAIDEIAAVPGLALVIIGPADLSNSLGVPGHLDHPTVIAHAERVIAACTARGVAVGIAGVTDAAFWVSKGVRFLCCLGDSSLLSEACHAQAAALRESVAAAVKKPV